jgi:predicted phage terminase large subunit-like protein
VVIEDKASGQSAIQSLSRPLATASGSPLAALPVLPFPDRHDKREVELARLDKYTRAEGVTATVASGHAYLPEGAPWVESFITEHADFPSAANDDQVDTTSMGLTRLAGTPGRPFSSAVGGSRPLSGQRGLV